MAGFPNVSFALLVSLLQGLEYDKVRHGLAPDPEFKRPLKRCRYFLALVHD